MQDLAVIETKEVAITQEQKELIRKTICKDATDAEMQLFFFDCQRRGTHPLDKLIHFTKRDGKYTPVTSIDFFRLRAHSSGAYAGEGATTYELGEDGLPNECTVAVLRLVQGQVCTWRATARWAEYYPGDKSGFMWKKMPFLMLAKCAEALALRKAFPAELHGLYVKEEMDQAGPPQKPLLKPSEILARSEASSVHEPTVAEALADIEKQEEPPEELFRMASAVADYEIVIGESTDRQELETLWGTITKDPRITSEYRANLYKHYISKRKWLEGPKGKKA